MIVFWRIFSENISFVFQEIKKNRLRTSLTLLGISIGIFCIISVFAIVDSMKSTIEKNIQSLGSNVLYIQKWPWEFSTDYQWWKYFSRPVPNMNEFKAIQQRSYTSEKIVFVSSVLSSIEHEKNKIDNIGVIGVTEDYPYVMPFDLAEGRFFSGNEFSSGSDLVVLGWEIADLFFANNSAIGKTVKLFNQKVKVVGVLAYEGSSPFSNSNDRNVITPIGFFSKHSDVYLDKNENTLIMVKVRKEISNVEARDELTTIMRSERKLKPIAEDNFSINESSLITQGFAGLFSILSIAGWFIGGFALLVGGFGIANIMFVTVNERTRIIGVQKAIGAKSYFIVLQYLFEAVILSLFGGFIGLLIVVILVTIISMSSNFDVFVSFSNVINVITITTFIGVFSGIAPALKAAKLDPVIAIRK